MYTELLEYPILVDPLGLQDNLFSVLFTLFVFVSSFFYISFHFRQKKSSQSCKRIESESKAICWNNTSKIPNNNNSNSIETAATWGVKRSVTKIKIDVFHSREKKKEKNIVEKFVSCVTIEKVKLCIILSTIIRQYTHTQRQTKISCHCLYDKTKHFTFYKHIPIEAIFVVECLFWCWLWVLLFCVNNDEQKKSFLCVLWLCWHISVSHSHQLGVHKDRKPVKDIKKIRAPREWITKNELSNRSSIWRNKENNSKKNAAKTIQEK